MATEKFLTYREAVALENLTDEDIRNMYRELERKTSKFQKELGFVPDIEDWEEYE